MGFNTQNQRSVSVYRNANQALTGGANTAMIWDTSTFNPNAMWVSGTNPNRITINKPGLYLINAIALTATNGTTNSIVTLRKNGTTVVLTTGLGLLTTAAFGVPVTGSVLAVTGDYFELMINSGASVNWTGSITVALIHPTQDWTSTTEAV